MAARSRPTGGRSASCSSVTPAADAHCSRQRDRSLPALSHALQLTGRGLHCSPPSVWPVASSRCPAGCPVRAAACSPGHWSTRLSLLAVEPRQPRLSQRDRHTPAAGRPAPRARDDRAAGHPRSAGGRSAERLIRCAMALWSMTSTSPSLPRLRKSSVSSASSAEVSYSCACSPFHSCGSDVRLIALLVGMLLATTAFTVLTAASRTSQLRTVGTVSALFAPAYAFSSGPRPPDGAVGRPTRCNRTSCPGFTADHDEPVPGYPADPRRAGRRTYLDGLLHASVLRLAVFADTGR